MEIDGVKWPGFKALRRKPEPPDRDYPVPSEPPLSWFGFDCHHLNDAIIDPHPDLRVRRLTALFEPTGPNEPALTRRVVRSLEYCVEECESLAEQLAVVAVPVTDGDLPTDPPAASA